MRNCILIIMFSMLCNLSFSQKRGGIEQYYYGGNKEISTVVPKVYYQNKKNWYAEVRYNYDDLKTMSFNLGKTFSNDNDFSYSVTPIAGLMAGKLNGGSLGLNLEAAYKKMFFSAESQYTFSAECRNDNFFYNWSELGYQITQSIYTGLALQLTRLYKTGNRWETGVMAGFSLNKFTFPLYVFNPISGDRYFVLGINIEWANL